MIRSQFLRDIISLLLDGEEHILLKNQADWIEEENFEYTGSGVFVRFKLQEQGLKFKFGVNNSWLGGVLIKSEEIDIAADATLALTDGFIDFLEIWSYGDIYPSKDPDHYTLEQQWKGENNRVIKR